jgi:hypothetical protein
MKAHLTSFKSCSLKETVSRDFCVWFYHKTTSLGPDKPPKIISNLASNLWRYLRFLNNSPLCNAAVSCDSPPYFTAANHDLVLYYKALSQIAPLFTIALSQIHDFQFKSLPCFFGGESKHLLYYIAASQIITLFNKAESCRL